LFIIKKNENSHNVEFIAPPKNDETTKFLEKKILIAIFNFFENNRIKKDF